MLWPKIFNIAAAISTVLSLCAFLAALFIWFSSRRRESSIVQKIKGEGIVRAKDVVNILKQFGSDELRLKALQTFREYEGLRAKGVLDKVKSEIEFGPFSLSEQINRRKQLVIAGVVLIIFALIAFLASQIGKPTPPSPPTPTPTATATPTPTPIPTLTATPTPTLTPTVIPTPRLLPIFVYAEDEKEPSGMVTIRASNRSQMVTLQNGEANYLLPQPLPGKIEITVQAHGYKEAKEQVNPQEKHFVSLKLERPELAIQGDVLPLECSANKVCTRAFTIEGGRAPYRWDADHGCVFIDKQTATNSKKIDTGKAILSCTSSTSESIAVTIRVIDAAARQKTQELTVRYSALSNPLPYVDPTPVPPPKSNFLKVYTVLPRLPSEHLRDVAERVKQCLLKESFAVVDSGKEADVILEYREHTNYFELFVLPRNRGPAVWTDSVDFRPSGSSWTPNESKAANALCSGLTNHLPGK